ncbi:PA2169 family four-helix-bundle protein [Cytobacillus firmus]|uniref:PA2169 family four-helix-bundle protein n=1 Tax=Cytobacillus firmus TaxID=1399 RepID=UPI002228162A|nr:PA2169 family four-helix-bundle protein [Cytobacillus firmus]
MPNDIIVEELNTLLKGTYMGVRAFEHYILKLDNTELREHFQTIQQELKQNASKIAERIQNLGGVPADGEGISGSMQSFMHKVMLPDETKKIIEDALEGLDKYGVQYSEEIVRGDLDAPSKEIVEEVKH